MPITYKNSLCGKVSTIDHMRFSSKSGTTSVESDFSATAVSKASAGIALGRNSPIANDGDDPTTAEIDPDNDVGENHLQNHPVLAGAIAASQTVVQGSLLTMPGFNYRIEFFSSGLHGPLGVVTGEQYLGAVNVKTNASGNAPFDFVSPTPVAAGRYITATATLLFNTDDNPATPDALIETSEFSAGIPVRENPWHNQAKPLDVKPDGLTVAGDALEIINYINAFGSGLVPPNAELGIPAYYDTTNDAFVAPDDALSVINYINAFGADTNTRGEGEPAAGSNDAATAAAELPPAAPQPAASTRPVADDLLALLALDLAQFTPARRRS